MTWRLASGYAFTRCVFHRFFSQNVYIVNLVRATAIPTKTQLKPNGHGLRTALMAAALHLKALPSDLFVSLRGRIAGQRLLRLNSSELLDYVRRGRRDGKR